MARPRGANRRRFVLALVVLTSLTLITLDSRSGRTGPLGSVGRLAHTIVSPVNRGTSAIARPIGDWWSGVFDSGSLKRENRKLRRQVAELNGKQREVQIALAQDAILRRLLGLRLLNSARPIPARVVDRDPGNFQSTITIDRGQEVGIEKGMAVISADGVVGSIINSWHGGADVRVLTDPESVIAVRTLKDPVVGIAEGHEGADDLVVSDFPAGTHVRVGDVVVTADITNSLFPPDLPVGKVSSVERQPAGLGLTVHIDPYVDFGALEFVDVLQWVPGEGPVVPPTTTTTTTTTLPGSTTTTGSSDTTETTTTTTTSSSDTSTSGTSP
jgi:rod shape-determining protein MreC